MTRKNYVYFDYSTIPGALTKEELNALLEKYHDSHDPLIRKQILDGTLKLLGYFVCKYGEPYINKITECEPSYEDLFQSGFIVLSNCIEKYQFSKDTTFSNYFAQALIYKFECMVKRKETRLKLESKATNLEDAEADNTCMINYISDEKANFVNDIISKIDMDALYNDIKRHLSERDAYIFKEIVINNKSGKEVGDDLGLSSQYIYLRFSKIIPDIRRLYLEGPSECEKRVNGIHITSAEREYISKIIEFEKRYSRDFLINYLPQKITASKFNFYKNDIFNYYGQKSVCYKLFERLDRLQSIVELVYNNYLQEMRSNNKEERSNMEINIEKNEDFVKRYGGKFYLYKKFYPLLDEKEQIVFKIAVLDYFGEDEELVAKKINMSLGEYRKSVKNIKIKLQKFMKGQLDLIK